MGYFSWQPLFVLDVDVEPVFTATEVPGIPQGLLNELLTPCGGIGGGSRFGFGGPGGGNPQLMIRTN